MKGRFVCDGQKAAGTARGMDVVEAGPEARRQADDIKKDVGRGGPGTSLSHCPFGLTSFAPLQRHSQSTIFSLPESGAGRA